MADDTQFSALLSSLLSIDNDARTQAEVIFKQMIVLLVEKIDKNVDCPRKMCFAKRKRRN